MQRYFSIFLAALLSLCFADVWAQDTPDAPPTTVVKRKAPTSKEEQPDRSTGVSVRRQAFAERMRSSAGEAPWKRIIYRELSLDSAANTVLYYPPRPTPEEQNLFTTLFMLIHHGQLKAYTYEDGYESFDTAHELQFGEFLDRYGIPYTTEADGSLNVATADIPSDWVKSYYLKEEYYFDPINSVIDVRPVALCPILFDTGDYGEDFSGGLRLPLFWVRYDDAKPFLSSRQVMLSDLNNASQATLDSYFRLRLYEGQIYKTHNRLGKALTQYCETPEQLLAEQKRIEAELKSFEQNIWLLANRETAEADAAAEEKAEEKRGLWRTSRARRQAQKEGASVEKTPAPKATKAKQPKQPKAAKASSSKKSSSSTRSARKRF